MQRSQQGEWSSRLSFILAATGAAVGLGNIWKFPYMAGAHGGSAFVIVYLLCVALVGLPLMIAEMLLGRMGRANAVTTLKELAIKHGHSRHWQLLGWWGAGTLVLVFSFYSVVAGWSLGYLYWAITGTFTGQEASQIQAIWHNFMARPGDLILLHSLFMILTLAVVARGITAGLEKASRLMMPALFLILIILVGYAMSTPGFNHGLHFLLDFKLQLLSPSVIISALGHACFTLAIGAGCMLAYGSYLPTTVKLTQSVIIIVLLDVAVAILTGLAIFPVVFSYHLSPQDGPGIMFETLPIAFAQMGGGRIIGCLFFLLLLFAAWTSSISLAEPLVVLLIERYRFTRIHASLLTGLIAWSLGLVTVLSFNLWSQVQLFHHWHIFDAITDLATNILLPLGAAGYGIFAGWIISNTDCQQGLHGTRPGWIRYWKFCVRYIAPVAILLILINSYF